ncbi:MAG: acetylglucosamine transferase, partial [Gammaproteobacteria bacterium]|nr:acetylglucosamine transferase [Gammaproteobacteria bacterium]
YKLVFWNHCEYRKYLMRMSAADLFLDTISFNAGATANDALWCGVPLITIMGECYHSRMSGSLLASVQMEELIADNLSNYEELAIRLGCDKAYLKATKAKLMRNKNASKLFDTSTMVSELERTYKRILA